MISSSHLPIRMIALDMDGTLLNDEASVSPRNIAAITSARASGIEVVIATGRRHSYAMKVLRGLNLPQDAIVVSSNGTVTRTIASGLLRRTLLPLETAHWLCHYLNAFRHALVLTFDKVGSSGEDTRGALVIEHLDHLHASIGAWMRSNEPYIQRFDPIESSLPPRHVSGPSIRPIESTDHTLGSLLPIQAMLCGNLASMRAAESHLLHSGHVASCDRATSEEIPTSSTAAIAIHRTEYPDKDLCLVDILPAGCSKGAALHQIALDHGISPDHILAIGDNWNDVSMFRAAGSAVLMQNAPEDLKALARRQGWTIGEHHLHDGVAVAIESILQAIPSRTR